MTRLGLVDNTREDYTCDQGATYAPIGNHRGENLSPGYDDRSLTPVADCDLLARISNGDRRALEVLYERHAGWLLVRLEHRCDNNDLADLALQDTFLSVWKSARKWRGDGEVAAWLWGIAIRRLIDHIRKANRSPKTVLLSNEAQVFLEDPEPTPDQRAVDNMASPELTEALDDLPKELLDVLIATTVDGLTNKEAAALLAIPIGTLKTRARRAKAILEESLR